MPKVLVIEDDAVSLGLMLRALQRNGFEALGATSGDRGFEMACQHAPDLIISDIVMDDVDGYTTLARIRNDAATATIPFILMTGQASKASMRQGMELGADDYLPKPFKIEELIAAVNARLKQRENTHAMLSQELKTLQKTISTALPREVHAPLSVITTCAQALRTHAAALRPKDVVRMADAIDQAGTQLLALFEKFLLYSHLEIVAANAAQVRELQAVHTPEAGVLLEARARELAARRNRSDDLLLDLEKGGAAMHPEYLEKVVEELLDNAFKFSEPGESVVVGTSVEQGTLTLTVQDYGRGMSPEQVKAIDAFIQFKRNTTEQRGLGLGLSIVSRLAKLHGGILIVQSRPGAGTLAVVELPAAYAPPQA